MRQSNHAHSHPICLWPNFVMGYTGGWEIITAVICGSHVRTPLRPQTLNRNTFKKTHNLDPIIS